MTWWHDAVVYQIYPRSFADADGDGLGDLAGITSRLDHLVDLGVDAIWLSPIYPSPMADGGYDVADYCDVDPRFGSLGDFDELIAQATTRNLRVIVDVVPNHCSVLHPCFQDALAKGPGSEERDRFIFRDGRGPDGASPPNDWMSMFGGPAWTRVLDGQWYLHLFDSAQPDWNWRHPAVPAMFEAVLRFWLDRGVAGIRVDVADHLFKDPDLPDDANALRVTGPMTARTHRPELHDLYRSWNAILSSYDPLVFPNERTAIGEHWSPPSVLHGYLSGDGLPQALNTTLLLGAWTPSALRRGIDDALAVAGEVPGRLPWTLGNHDVVRPATRLAMEAPEPFLLPTTVSGMDTELGLRRARAAVLLQLALPGSAYVYQGEELGLPEVIDIAPEHREDPTFHRTGGTMLGRDGCRVPIPWSGDDPPFGFSPADSDESWLAMPASWRLLTIERQGEDPTSMLSLYRKAISHRPSRGTLTWMATEESVLAFRRGDRFISMTNFGSGSVELPPGTLTLASAELDEAGRLPSDSTAWITVALANDRDDEGVGGQWR